MSYFNIEEFRCKDGSFPDWAKQTIATRLLPGLDIIRERFGHPIRVNSGYRSPAYNKAINGSTGSYHTKALAADIEPVDMSLWPQFCRVVDACWREGLFGGKGVYATFRHVDVGPHRTWGPGEHYEKGDDMGMTPEELQAFQSLQGDLANFKTAEAKANLALQTHINDLANRLTEAISALSVNNLASVDAIIKECKQAIAKDLMD